MTAPLWMQYFVTLMTAAATLSGPSPSEDSGTRRAWDMQEDRTSDLKTFLKETAWEHRLLVIAGPRKEVDAQIEALTQDFHGVLDRDIIVLELTGAAVKDRIGILNSQPSSRLIAEYFSLDDDGFQMALVGKDTGVKERYDALTQPETIWSTIDVMPMRRSEKRGRSSSASGAPQHAFYAFRNGLTSGSPAANAALVKELGYDGIGSVEGKLVSPYAEACRKLDLRIFSCYLGGTVTVDGWTTDDPLDKAITALAGTDAVIELFVRAERNATDKQAIQFVQSVASKAASAKLRVALYPHAGFHVATVADAVRIAKASGCANVGVAFNLCHFLKVEPDGDLRETLKLAAPLLWSVSTCGADAEGTSWKTLIRPLDEGSFDQRSLLRTLREVGYRGPVGLQCFGIQTGPEENLERSVTSWKRLTRERR
ncbi:MAG: DUF4174 domain-containing protein [Planctomycetota bacterium]